MGECRYQDREWLEKQWQTADSVPEIAEKCDVTPSTITTWARRHGLPHFSEARPYNDPEVLRGLYWGEKMTLQEVADEVGCTDGWVGQKMEEFDIPRRGELESRAVSNPSCQYYTHPRGYVFVAAEHDGTTQKTGVHQLVAIADGADPYDIFADDYIVHHKNRVKWDNRPCNLQTMTMSEHGRLHYESGETNPHRSDA